MPPLSSTVALPLVQTLLLCLRLHRRSQSEIRTRRASLSPSAILIHTANVPPCPCAFLQLLPLLAIPQNRLLQLAIFLPAPRDLAIALPQDLLQLRDPCPR